MSWVVFLKVWLVFVFIFIPKHGLSLPSAPANKHGHVHMKGLAAGRSEFLGQRKLSCGLSGRTSYMDSQVPK